MELSDLKQILDENVARLEDQKKMLNLIFDMMQDTNRTLKYCIEQAEKEEIHDYLGQLEKEHELHNIKGGLNE